MDGISQVASSINAMNDVLKMAQSKSLDLAKKMVEVSVEGKVGGAKQAGIGEVIDSYA